jgi:hypothetical protein
MQFASKYEIPEEKIPLRCHFLTFKVIGDAESVEAQAEVNIYNTLIAS